jgi:hypothetical protein
VTLQIREIQTALKDPNATMQEVVDQTTCSVTSSFASGQELLEKGRAFFNAWRSVNSEKMRWRATVAGLTHFESADRKRKLPGPSEMVCIRSPDDAQPRLNTLEAFLKDKMCRSGDKRLDVEQAMSKFATLVQAARNNFPAEPGSISFAQLMSSFDVAYLDLPPKPTLGDFLDEIDFQSQCRALEEAAGWPPKALRGRIKQNQVPSRVIIREIQRQAEIKAELSPATSTTIISQPSARMFSDWKWISEPLTLLSAQRENRPS